MKEYYAMTKQTKVKILAFFLILGISISGFAQSWPSLEEVQKTVDDFSWELAKSLPFNSSLGLNWSDAYIGKFFPSLPPHFGVGGSFGITTMDLPVMRTLMNYFGYSMPFDIGKLILPAYAAEARIGGLFLPFDVGVKFGYLPPVGLWGQNLDMDYLLVGGDIRYKLLDLKVIKLSVGFGINYLRGGVSGKVGSDQQIEYGTESIILEKPEVNLKWDTVSFDFKTQVSFSLLLFTPYAGVAASYARSSAGYSIDAPVQYSSGDMQDVIDYINSEGLVGMDLSDTGISSNINNTAFGFRAFGGVSLNFVVFKLDFTGIYSFRDNNFGGSLGFRFQM